MAESIMQNTFKSTVPSLAFLLIGMTLFFLLRTFPIFITIEKMTFGIFIFLCFYGFSLMISKYERISLSLVNLVPGRQTLLYLFLGFIVGSAITGFMLLLLFSLTDLSIQRINGQNIMPFLLASLVIIPLALMEEILFRGYPFFRLAQLINIRLVILITAVLFGLYHYNGSQSVLMVLIGPGVWGVVFGVAAYLSNSLALPLGIHISANYLQVIFGLKNGYVSLYEIIKVDNQILQNLDPNYLGVIMQIIVLFVALIVLELSIKQKNQKASVK